MIEYVLAGVLMGQVSGFVENRGQWPDDVGFGLIADGRLSALATTRGIVVVEDSRDRSARVTVRLAPEGCREIARDEMRADEIREYRSHFLRGNDPGRWARDARSFGSVRLPAVVPGVDLVLRDAGGGAFEYDLVVAGDSAAARAGGVAIRVEGARVARDSERVVLRTPLGTIEHGAARTFVVDASGARRAVSCTTEVTSESSLRFVFAAAGESVVVDPTVTPIVEAGSYLGGSGFEDALTHVVASDGSIVVAGRTESLDFPVTPGVVDTTYSNKGDAFVARFQPGLGSLAFATYLGGVRIEKVMEIAIDGQGRIVIAGETDSPDFPATPGAFQTVFGAIGDGFVTRLTADGSALAYSTFLGGDDLDYVHGMQFASDGDVVLCGHTHSADFPVTPGAYDTQIGGHSAFVARLEAAGNALAFATYVGGFGDDHAYALGLLSDDSPLVGGSCEPTAPLTPNAFDSVIGGHSDAYLFRLDASGSTMLFATAFGGSGDADSVLGLAVDAADRAIVVGITTSTDLPLPPSAWDATLGGIADAFVARVDVVNGTLLAATYLGGAGYDIAQDVELDAGGAAWVVGTASNGFPITADSIAPGVSGSSDWFAARFDPTCSQLLHASVVGGAGNESAYAVSVRMDGRIVVSGNGAAPGLALPPTSYQLVPNAVGDALVLEIDACAGSFTTSAAACPAGALSPTLVGAGCPMPGHAMTITAHAGASAAGVLLVGLGTTPLALNPNCSLSLGPLSALAVALAFPTGQSLPLGFTVPAGTPAFDLSLQLVIGDASVAGGIAASAPLIVSFRP